MSDTEYSESIEVGLEENERNEGMRQTLIATPSSSSSEESSTSTSSDSDNSAEEDSYELTKICKHVLHLPKGLCENASIFREFFSLDTWRSLPIPVQNHLQQFLPRFSQLLPPQLDAVEQTRTLSMLFNGRLQRFGQTPLSILQRELERGNYRPDILKLRQNIAKSNRREQRFRQCERLSQLAKQLFLSRQRLIDTAYQSSPDTVIKVQQRAPPQPKATQLYADNKLSAIRARKRFHGEISQMAEQLGLKSDDLSADEEGDDKLTIEELKDDALVRTSAEEITEAAKSTANLVDRCVYDTLFKRQKEVDDEEACRLQQGSKQLRLCNKNFRNYLRDHKRRKLTEPTLPEFETSDIRLRDVCARAQMGGNFKRIFALGKTQGRKPKQPTTSTVTRSTPTTVSTEGTATISSLISPIGVKLSEPPALVPIQPLKKSEIYRTTPSHLPSIHKESLVRNVALMSDATQPNNFSDMLTEDHEAFNMLDSEVELQQEEVETFSGTCEETIPAFVISNDAPAQQKPSQQFNSGAQVASGERPPLPKLEPISNNHLKHHRVTAAKVIISPSSNTSSNGSSELIQETHSSFFSLIRDFFCSTPNYRMRYDELKVKIDIWLRNPITALNEWYSMADNWSFLLRSAINFLVGDFTDLPDEYVPYIEFKSQISIYQWIGAGRDSDKRLTSLCQTWLEKRRQYEQGAPFNLQKQQGWDAAGLSRSSLDNEDSSGAYDCNSTEGGIAPPPPPPRYPTTWKVKSASPAEMLEFQRQERERFEKPHRAYTYRMHGYESVVGPVKGIYTAMLAMTKARGHSMMVGDRPNFVTILTLVRDATARLPNGEGTRADISELLKCSQYINRDAAENVLQTIVSGALDRMHTEHDPCVRYDPKRKIWIYLHRNRTEEEFERLHQQNQCVGKVKKLIPRKPRTPTNLKTEVSISETPSKTFTDTTQSAAVLLPALVPSTSLVTNNNVRRQQQQQQPPHQQLLLGNKCLPVPPLKYNIPPHTVSTGVQQQQQHQKSLLKSNIRQENNSVGSNTSVIVQNATAVPTNKHYSYPMTQTNMTSTSGNSNSNTATPIIVATPQGLHTVRVANANTHEANVALLSPGSATPTQTTVKRMPLNKSIVINPISQQQQQQSTAVNSNYKLSNTKPSSQAIKQTAAQHRLTPSASAPCNASQLSNSHTDGSGIMIPLSMANAANVHSTSTMVIQTTPPPPIIQNKNFLRLVQTSSGAKPTSQSTCQIVSRQRILASTNLVATSTPSLTSNNNRLPTGVQFQQPMSKAPSGLQITSNTNTNSNTNLITIGSGPNDVGGGAANPTGATSVVRMSAQAFANLQQKQQLQQRVTIKSGNSQTPITAAPKPPQRLILGNTTVLAAPLAQSAQKNIVLQQLPIVVAKSAANSTPTTPMATSKIQTINTSNLTPQQQRVLIQNLKQQNNSATQTQYKTVQILNANSSQHQQQQSSRSPILNAQQQVGKTLAVMVSQNSPIPQAQQQASTITRIIKTNPIQVKAETNATSNTRMISSSGQVVSLESLLQKKGNALRITGPSNAAVAKTSQTTAGNVQHKVTVTPQQQQQQQQTQYAVMSMAQPINNNNIINLGGTTLTMGQRLVSTQANDNSSGSKAVPTSNAKIVRSSDASACTPPINRIVTAGNKPLTKTVVTPASIGGGNIRVINASGQMSNLNLASLQGKQVVFTSANPAHKQLTNVIKNQTPATSVVQQQSGNVMISGQAVKLQQVINKSGNIVNAATSVAVGSCSNTAPVQTLLMGNQVLRVHQMPQIVTTSAAANNKTNETSNQKSGGASTSKTIFLGSTGQTLRLQSNLAPGTTLTNKNIVIQRSNANSNQQNNTNVSCKINNASPTTSTPNRVVLAVQGGGQIFLSPTFQGGNLNLKSLQNMKLVSLTNQSNVKDVSVLSPATTKATNS